MTDRIAIRIKAASARRLVADEAFQDFVADVRAQCLTIFENSGPADTGTREEAHALLRAITKLQGAISAASFAGALEQKREGQHRG